MLHDEEGVCTFYDGARTVPRTAPTRVRLLPIFYFLFLPSFFLFFFSFFFFFFLFFFSLPVEERDPSSYGE